MNYKLLTTFGYLSFYFNTVDKKYDDATWATKTLSDNINYNSEFLRQNGKDILRSDSTRLTEVLEFLKTEQRKWVEPLTKRQGDR